MDFDPRLDSLRTKSSIWLIIPLNRCASIVLRGRAKHLQRLAELLLVLSISFCRHFSRIETRSVSKVLNRPAVWDIHHPDLLTLAKEQRARKRSKHNCKQLARFYPP